MSLDFDVFVVDPKPIPSAVPGFEDAVGPATWPPSTSTLISDDGGALLVDCLITEREGRELAAWVKSRGREPGYVYITHPHADHFLGLPEILAAFPEARPVALAESIAAMEEQISPRYMQVWSGFFPSQLTSKPVAPAPLAGTTVPVGDSPATAIPVGTTDTGHSSVVHVPGLVRRSVVASSGSGAEEIVGRDPQRVGVRQVRVGRRHPVDKLSRGGAAFQRGLEIGLAAAFASPLTAAAPGGAWLWRGERIG